MNAKHQQKKPRIKATLKYLVVLVLVLLVTIFQDYLHSRSNEYPFYASESFLFNTFWILILPVAFLLNWFFQKGSINEKLPNLFVQRILFVLVATVIHMLLFAGLVHLISASFYEDTFRFARNLRFTVLEDLYKYLLIYSVIALVLMRKKKPDKIEKAKFLEQLLVGSGRTKIAIKCSDIIYICAASPYIEIHSGRKKHLHSTTLKSILEKLNPEQFVQIHKSTIVNISKVVSYKSRLNGDYDVLLSDEKELRLSRNYVDNFKQKLSSSPSS
ncbi:LytR/AlgR family response regulator transcription factor [Algoriphagus aquimarinus]|uniref:LytTr DNA-binding domain-containing protein n=1 Tax=Algoriphagus aquimarinus TaxID=237018 RepID=A0A1I0VKP1_9BACT|nr:LytTR family DNA-binding domain-containing protein [Algoriphagus aquimarinus]SFA76768.1 LytTr DNA-binding domain-containing protein [Algoriphagus aquimarinus]